MFFKKKIPPPDKNAQQNKEPEGFNEEKAWREGFLMTKTEVINPQEFSDRNNAIYANNNVLLHYAIGGCVLIIAVFSTLSHLAFLSIDDPSFYTTTPNGLVEKLATSQNPNRLKPVLNQEQARQELLDYYKANPETIRWFDGKPNPQTKIAQELTLPTKPQQVQQEAK